jgi:hypothetical protein
MTIDASSHHTSMLRAPTLRREPADAAAMAAAHQNTSERRLSKASSESSSGEVAAAMAVFRSVTLTTRLVRFAAHWR